MALFRCGTCGAMNRVADGRIGSGVVEAACKTLVTQRMKQSGMRWEEAGGQAILTARGRMQSGDRFDRAWALLAATRARRRASRTPVRMLSGGAAKREPDAR